MTTLDDKATEQEEMFREMALRARELSAKKQRIRPRGECIFCGETDLPDPESLFCCDACNDDWHARQRAKEVAGIR